MSAPPSINPVIISRFKTPRCGGECLFRLRIKIWKYWELPDYIKKSSYIPIGEYLEELENLLTDSIKRQFVSDVPVGLLLSGGIDSSLVTALASKSISKLKTFTITFPGYSDFDESNHASLIADHFSTEHTELECPDISVDLINKLAIQYDEPIADSSMFPTYMVTKLIKRVVVDNLWKTTLWIIIIFGIRPKAS